MADFSDKMKKAWLKSMEAIGNTAGNIASNTRYKVNEMTLLNRRREILSDFGARAYDLWQKGEVFPEELAQQLQELSQVDIQFNALRMERLAGVKTPDEQEKAPEADDSSASANSAVPGPTGCEQNASDGQPGTSPLVDKANQSLGYYREHTEKRWQHIGWRHQHGYRHPNGEKEHGVGCETAVHARPALPGASDS